MNLNREALRHMRELSGHTQTSLAEIVAVDKSTINRLESGTRNPSPTLMRELAAALGCPLHALIGPNGEAAG